MTDPVNTPPEKRPPCLSFTSGEPHATEGLEVDDTPKAVDGEGAEDEELQSSRCLDLGIAYVANYGGDSVSVVNIAQAQEVTQIPVGNGPHTVAASPDRCFVYVSNFLGDTLSVIRTLSNTVVATVDLNAGPFTSSGPVGVALSRNSRFVYVANWLSANISIVDAHQLAVVAEIPIPWGPGSIGITPDGNMAYVTLPNHHAVGIVDLNANLQLGTTPVGTYPVGIDIARHKPLAYAAVMLGNYVRAVNTDLGAAAITPIAVGASPTGVSFNPGATVAYVTNQTSNTVSVIDVFSHAQALAITVGHEPIGVKAAENGFAVLVANSGSDTVSIIDARTNSVTATVPVGSSPFHIDII